MEIKTDMEIISEYDEDINRGITVCENYFFILVRITGIGITKRIDDLASIDSLKNILISNSYKTEAELTDMNLNEVVSLAKHYNIPNLDTHIIYKEVDRDSEYIKDKKVLEAMQGLPILKNHPHNGENSQLLNYNNLKDNPIIGTVIKVYEKEDSIWGLAKIFDITLLEEMEKYKSTSPAVESYICNENDKLVDYPFKFNHLAFVEKGHWDQIDTKAYNNDIICLDIPEDERTEDEFMNDKNDETENINPIIRKGETMEEKTVDNKIEINEQVDTTMENVEDSSNDSTDIPINTDIDEDNLVEIEVEKEPEEDLDSSIDEDDTDIIVKDDIPDEDDEFIIEDEEENILDEERENVIDHFRNVIDNAHPSTKVDLKMPYTKNKRLTPSDVVKKILRLNSNYSSYKYRNVDSLKSYGLLMDAYQELVDNINKKSNELYAKRSDKKNYWTPGRRQGESFDKNF